MLLKKHDLYMIYYVYCLINLSIYVWQKKFIELASQAHRSINLIENKVKILSNTK